MDINDLYKRLETIFVDYTTFHWKNGWMHEGDRQSKELSIQKDVPWNNLFLLQTKNIYTKTGHIIRERISLDGPMGFKIEVKKENNNLIRIDIESKQLKDINIYYHIDNELDWLSTIDFITELCQNIYDSNVNIKKYILNIPTNIYGNYNPEFTKQYRRDIQLKKIGI